jgi:hypothetical protein
MWNVILGKNGRRDLPCSHWESPSLWLEEEDVHILGGLDKLTVLVGCQGAIYKLDLRQPAILVPVELCDSDDGIPSSRQFWQDVWSKVGASSWWWAVQIE